MTAKRIPYSTLEQIVMRLGEDRFHKVTEIHRLRAENEELHTLLRTALWQMAQLEDPKHAARYVNRWMDDRKKREL